MEFQEAIEKRRSIRRFTDYYVPDEEILAVIEAARLAQSWANTQVWEFIVVRDREIIQKITSAYSETNPSRKCSNDASALIIACAKTGVSGSKGGHDVTKYPTWFMFDMGIAVQNLCLRAHEMGLGTVVVGLMDHDRCKKVLEIPEGYEVVVAIPIGKPATTPKDGPPRKELKSFVHLDQFGRFMIA